jgi:hypothetical protein
MRRWHGVGSLPGVTLERLVEDHVRKKVVGRKATAKKPRRETI